MLLGSLIALLAHLWIVQWGGFGYDAYCGISKYHGKLPAAKACSPPDPREDPIAPASPPFEPCTFACKQTSKSKRGDWHPPMVSDAPPASDLAAVLRNCEHGEVRVEEGQGACSVAINLVGERFGAGLVLSGVKITNVHLDRTSLNGLLFWECSFANGSPFTIHDSSIDGPLVVSPSSPAASPTRVHVERTRIGGDANLQRLRLSQPFVFRDSTVTGALLLDHTELEKSAELRGTQARLLSLHRAKMNEGACLADLHVERLSLATASARKPLVFNGGKIDVLTLYADDYWIGHENAARISPLEPISPMSGRMGWRT